MLRTRTLTLQPCAGATNGTERALWEHNVVDVFSHGGVFFQALLFRSTHDLPEVCGIDAPSGADLFGEREHSKCSVAMTGESYRERRSREQNGRDDGESHNGELRE
jgi:hypothetical protein